MDKAEEIKQKKSDAVRRGPVSQGELLDMERELSAALEAERDEARNDYAIMVRRHESAVEDHLAAIRRETAANTEIERLREHVALLADDGRKMKFVRDTLARADRAEMNETTTDRFVVGELRRVVMPTD